MSGVIKKQDLAGGRQVRSFGAPIPVTGAPAPGPTALDLATADIARLTLEIQRLEAEARDSASAREKAYEAGRLAGIEAGRKLGDDERAGALERLERGVSRAQASLVEAIGSLEDLAPLLAREGLARILGEESEQAPLVVQAVREQLKQLSQSAVLRISVSPVDFPSTEQLAALAATLDVAGARIDVDERLSAGECQFKLVLGTLEVGPAQQWRSLERQLTGLTKAGRP